VPSPLLKCFPYSERRDKISTGSSALTALEHTLDTVKNKIKMVVKTDRPFLSIVNPPQSNKFI
jgi:UTP:GlnB (protein PII) uridylyltransferase